MAHAMWKGSISFGLVNIPVKMHSATREHELKFSMLHKKDLSRIRYAYVCKEEEREIPYEEIVKGYEYEPGEYVVFDKEDFQKANLEKSQSIDIAHFVNEDEIDSIYFAKPYYLMPEKNAVKVYRLLCEALRKSKKVGIAKYVFHNKEYLGIIKASDNVLVLNQLRFEEEIVQPEAVTPTKKESFSEQELSFATKLIDQLTTQFDPTQYRSTYIDELKEMIETKAKGKTIHPKGAEAKPSKVQDIMTLLKASLEETTPKKTRKPPSRKSA